MEFKLFILMNHIRWFSMIQLFIIENAYYQNILKGRLLFLHNFFELL